MKLRLKGSDEITGFLDKGTNVTGELEFNGTLRIDGSFHGSISTAGILLIGERAVVHADIKAGEVQVHGQVFGTIETQNRVEVFSTGRVRGDISTPVLIMSSGALLDGRLRMCGDRPEDPAQSVNLVNEENTRQERR
jgi:cytoskeletal protein CcmA (bactofilin family)